MRAFSPVVVSGSGRRRGLCRRLYLLLLPLLLPPLLGLVLLPAPAVADGAAPHDAAHTKDIEMMLAAVPHGVSATGERVLLPPLLNAENLTDAELAQLKDKVPHCVSPMMRGRWTRPLLKGAPSGAGPCLGRAASCLLRARLSLRVRHTRQVS